jgi:hypothetical protein
VEDLAHLVLVEDAAAGQILDVGCPFRLRPATSSWISRAIRSSAAEVWSSSSAMRSATRPARSRTLPTGH